MPDYAKYRAALKLTNNDFISVIGSIYPGFTKIQCTMINKPAKYGVQLTKEAEEALIDKYGYSDGLSVKKKTKRSVKRIKTNRLTVRLDNASYDKLKNKMQQRGSESVQSFLEEIIRKETAE